MDDMMNMSMFAFATTPSHVMIGFGVVNLVCVITKMTRGMLFLSGSSWDNFRINLNLIYHKLSLNSLCKYVVDHGTTYLQFQYVHGERKTSEQWKQLYQLGP